MTWESQQRRPAHLGTSLPQPEGLFWARPVRGVWAERGGCSEVDGWSPPPHAFPGRRQTLYRMLSQLAAPGWPLCCAGQMEGGGQRREVRRLSLSRALWCCS